MVFAGQTDLEITDLKDYSSPLLSMGDIFQHLQWMPEILGSIEPYINYCFFPIHTMHMNIN